MTSVSIRVDAHHQIGYGHLKRCLVLGDALTANGTDVSFVLAGDDQAKELVGSREFACTSPVDETAFARQAATLDDDIPKEASLIVTDIAHGVALRNGPDLATYLAALNRRYQHVAIDGSGELSLRRIIPDLACDLLVSPYVGETRSAKPVPYEELLGTGYFILGQEYLADGARDIRTAANRILVTCGGSDPTMVTDDIMSALHLCTGSELDIKVVIGPGFKPDYCERLRASVNSLRHTLAFIEAPDNIAEQMAWCDLAISTSGLTKYELAVTGTPAILVSIDSGHDDINRIFSAQGSVLDLGIAGKVTATVLAKNIMALLGNADERRRQSVAGKKLVDGKGTNRLARAIESLAQQKKQAMGYMK